MKKPQEDWQRKLANIKKMMENGTFENDWFDNELNCLLYSNGNHKRKTRKGSLWSEGLSK